ncbi:fermentation-respiration switch protein FrsA (DUF1100 family) [Beijerinckia sp. GAS462]|nr:alpha/beta hydrolase [Beijerinckia sp. GAS462]MDH7794895.1 fermentation-respiration switch protein FrsA (DUF1100 family) [Beijerinckia sp. GAS462]SEB79605.1 hypothetical protein SAMN05443249_1169 [Beijerinckia sp. 28-YEA-48]
MKQQPVTFDSAGLKLAGILHMPEGNASAPRPAIIVGHPASSVKEQTAGLYARRLAEQGFITLAFDTATQGESEGQPRGVEDPARRIEEFRNAVSFLSVQQGIDPDRIGVLGVCAAFGYAIPAAATDHRIKAVASVSGFDVGAQFRVGADGKQDPAVLQHILGMVSAARTAEARGEGIGTLPLFPANEAEARAGGRHLFEGWEYYCTDRAQHPRSAKTFTLNSLDRLATFDPVRFVGMIAPRPLLMIVGTEAVTKWVAEDAFRKAGGPKELFWIDGATHVDLYDKPKYVTPASAKLGDFFRSHLGA